MPHIFGQVFVIIFVHLSLPTMKICLSGVPLDQFLQFEHIRSDVNMEVRAALQRQYLNCYYLLNCHMSAQKPRDRDDKAILLRAYECKIKSKMNIQQFLDIVSSDVKLSKMGEKGLFILYLCEMLLKAYIANGLKIRNFISELDKKEVKKRQRREGGQHRKRRKPREKKRGEQGKTLQQLSNQSLSNPSNVERPRINVETKQEQSANQVPQSKQKGEDSNGSKDNSSKDKLKLELNKITEEIQRQEDTYVPEVDFLPGTTTFEDNSQSSSSQTGQISNLSQKLKIFTSSKQTQRRQTTTRRKTTNAGTANRQTRTKKKKYQIIDQSTFIEETRATDNDLTLNYNETSHFDTQDVMDLDLVDNFVSNLRAEEKSIGFDIFVKEKIEGLRAAIHVDTTGLGPIADISQNYGMMTTEDLPMPDYTMSQPTSAPLYEPDFFKQSLQIKDSQFNFEDLVSHSSKDKSTLFYQLLWREQNDEISLFQRQPESFSVIKVKHK